MGFKIGEDQIGVLSHNTGVITLQPSLVTVGGQQYRITSAISRTIATDVSLANGGLYIIFVVNNSGSLELRISSNMNSVGPAGFTAWGIVGAFYANNVPAWGAFVNITGAPRCDDIASGLNIYSVPGGTVTKGVTSIDLISIAREGQYANIISHYVQAAGASTGGNPVNLLLPGAISADSGTYNFYTGTGDSTTAAGSIVGKSDGWYSTNINQQPVLYDANHLAFKNVLALATNGWWLGNSLGFGNAFGISTLVRLKVSGWSNTQLKDL